MQELWDGAVQGTDRPVVIFNADLDRLRANYYPGFVYPRLAKVSKELVPQVPYMVLLFWCCRCCRWRL